MKKNAMEVLKEIDADTATAFQALRNAVKNAGPLDSETADLIVVGTLVSAGNLIGLKVHAGRMLREGTSIEALRQAALVGFGQTTGFGQVSAALKVINELEG